jgi:hypothetical protein
MKFFDISKVVRILKVFRMVRVADPNQEKNEVLRPKIGEDRRSSTEPERFFDPLLWQPCSRQISPSRPGPGSLTSRSPRLPLSAGPSCSCRCSSSCRRSSGTR